MFRNFFSAKEMRHDVVDGKTDRYTYTGEHLQVVEYRFPPNNQSTPHKHDEHEQMGYVVKGKVVFTVNGEEKTLGPGDWYHAPVGVMHSCRTLDEPVLLLDVFSPPRDDLR